jgi:hypothetical protein
MAEVMFAAKTFSDIAYYEPFYLKDFVAEKKIILFPVKFLFYLATVSLVLTKLKRRNH